MKKLASQIICWVMLLVFILPAQVCGEALSLAEKADKIARSIVQDYAVTSVQYALSDKGRIVLSGNSGVFSKAENRLITANDMYGIGSTSKMFVTAAAMILWDQGLIDLDEPIVSYIPEFSMVDERYKEITPRMLMNHSSGLYGSSLANAFLFDDNSTMAHDTLLEKLSTQRLKAVPGEFSEYCNDGFSLLEILVERVSGISYTDFLAEHFIKPLGLVNTKTPMDDFDKAKRLVKTYIPPFEGALPNDTVNVLGTGGLYSTAEELCAFAQVLMGNRPEILSEQATLMMQNEEYKRGMWVDAEGDNYIGCYGLGWDTVHSFPFSDYGIQVLTKGGDTQLFHSSLVVIPALDIAMAVVSSGGASIIDYAFAANILQEYLLETGVIQQITPRRTATAPVQAAMPEALEAYSGLYVNTQAGANIKVKEGILTVSLLNGGTEKKYTYVGSQGFLSDDGSERVTFSQQADGERYLQNSRIISLPGVGQAAMTALEYQKVEPCAPESSILDVWKVRAGKKYYAVSEMPTAQGYYLAPGNPAIVMKLNEDFSNGFAFAGVKIVDVNYAVNTVKFRDVLDLEFIVRNGAEYVRGNDMMFIREDCIPDLSPETAVCMIGEIGYAEYYAITPQTQGKTLAVSLPENGAYAVYDGSDACVYFSTVSVDNTTVLPANGKIAFIGKQGDMFGIEFR